MPSPTGEKHTLNLAQDFIWTRIGVPLTSYVHNPINKPLERTKTTFMELAYSMLFEG